MTDDLLHQGAKQKNHYILQYLTVHIVKNWIFLYIIVVALTMSYN